ncbi:MAG TPA: hypothetical protein VK037_06420 [Pseudogracilibacillus sp.]|mgnify:CR=1 FL=1|nr:hypothetical protein [Pseudogracilibacillus sp.]
MSVWFIVNFIIFLFVVIKVSEGNLMPHTIVGGLGMLFILYNWTRHAVFTTIRSSIPRERKIIFAKLSKKVLPLHKWTGTSALIIICIHFILVLRYFPFELQNIKMITGLIALTCLIGVVIFGWLRHFRTTVARRYIHWTFAYLVILSTVIHIFMA